MEVDGKYIVRLNILTEYAEKELTALNEEWAKYLDYYP
jgi:hypothetical protein